jgi:PIN domain nuclease of toxin-antitoxin system
VIVLDTHAWIWWVTAPERLGKKATRAIKKASRVGIPAISVWEIATKAQRGKLKFDRPYPIWLDQALAEDPRTELIALVPRIAIATAGLPWAHTDPADRMIVATALVHQIPLVTADERIWESQLVSCIWD